MQIFYYMTSIFNIERINHLIRHNQAN